MKTIIHKAEDRGHANHGWLNAKHSFSFAGWYNPEKIQFGALRVLNDDEIAPGMGFSMHPHDNMEIITLVQEGELEHKDSMGNGSIIKANEVQVMSAGSGVYHSEKNASKSQAVKLF
ncbi:MAG: pirin family protein, partial [Bacteroidia bacterium]|nr:pirin family protein [Bacteroidia bacterium]